jgi:hypothetical protein
LLDDNANDYALLKVLTGLDPDNLRTLRSEADVKQFVNDRKNANNLKALIPYRNFADVVSAFNSVRSPAMGTREDVLIVGHGSSTAVWTEPSHGGRVSNFQNLANWVEDVAPKDWQGKVTFLTCNSAWDDGEGGSNVVKKLLEAFAYRYNVTGQPGFAYGMGPDRPLQVLREEVDPLYHGDEYDAELAAFLKYIADQEPDAANLIGHPAHQVDAQEVWRLFVAKMKEIQNRLDQIVRGNPANDILEKARSLKNDHTFKQAIDDQFKLFDAFDLWQR